MVPARAEVAALTTAQLSTITAARLRTHVDRLADDRLRGRPTPSPQLDEAATYLREQLSHYGLQTPPGIDDYRQTFECGGDAHPGPASNVIALLPGRDPALADQTVMVTAHYDHLGERPGGEDSIFNGANDNASGTAAMLAIAEVLAVSPPRRSVVFVGFCGEERGLLGSRHYAAHPVRPLEDVVAQVNLEMLGRPEPGPPLVVWIPGMERSTLGQWLATPSDPERLRVVDGTEIGRAEGRAFDRSDNYPLAMHGVVAHTVAAGKLDALYHSPDDEADVLDYEPMAVIVQALARGVHHLAEHAGRPAWIDPPS
ncbi:MAG: M28 family peptidase [Nannocystaceae bacterium]